MKNTQQFDVFLAHNSKDKPQVRAIAEKLKRQGLKPWLDEKQIHGGDFIPRKVQDGLVQSHNFALFFGLHGLGEFQEKWEVNAIIMLALNKKLRIIPILLPGVNELPKDQPFFASLRYLQFHNSVDEAKPLKELVKTLKETITSEGKSFFPEFTEQEQLNESLKEAGIKLRNTTYKQETSTILSDQPTFNQIIGSITLFLGATVAIVGAIMDREKI